MIILHSEDDVRWVLVGWRRQLGYALGRHYVVFGSAFDRISLGTPRMVLYKDDSIHWISLGQSFNQMILGYSLMWSYSAWVSFVNGRIHLNETYQNWVIVG